MASENGPPGFSVENAIEENKDERNKNFRAYDDREMNTVRTESELADIEELYSSLNESISYQELNDSYDARNNIPTKGESINISNDSQIFDCNMEAPFINNYNIFDINDQNSSAGPKYDIYKPFTVGKPINGAIDEPIVIGRDVIPQGRMQRAIQEGN